MRWREGGAKDVKVGQYCSQSGYNWVAGRNVENPFDEVITPWEGTHHPAVEISAIESIKDFSPRQVDHLG